MAHLKIGTKLKGGKYTIRQVLGQGGFGITYLAVGDADAHDSGKRLIVAKVSFWDKLKGKFSQNPTNGTKYTVKEFFMKSLCNRTGRGNRVSVPSTGSRNDVAKYKEKFIKEAQNIHKLQHPNIIKVYDVFEENDTAYYVMEYIGGGSLKDFVETKGRLSEDVALRYTGMIARALEHLHSKKMLHLDVKPGNILLRRRDNSAVLIDFGLSKNYDKVGDATSSTPIGVSVGYAPIEQSQVGGVGKFAPTVDIYSLGATLYKLLTGKTPPPASDILTDGLPSKPDYVSADTWAIVEKTMQPRPADRPQSISDIMPLFEEYLDADTVLKPGVKRKSVPIRRFTVNGVSFNMIFVEGGTFMMGATKEQGSDADNREKPAHQVTLSNYFIGETEVTQALWKAVMGKNPSYFKGDNKPVEQVSWADCQEFIKKLNELTGETFRLPTEAEWEYAARGGNKSKGYKHSGSNNIDDVAWYYENSCKMGKDSPVIDLFDELYNNENNHKKGIDNPYGTHDVATKQPNELGIFDMSGNVNEWCQDFFSDSYYSCSPHVNPTGPSFSITRVIRGGSWEEDAGRLSGRGHIYTDEPFYNIGLRLAL